MITQSHPRRGLTLLECIFAFTLLTILAVTTAAALERSRVLRGASAERARMAMVAQSAMDRARLQVPAADAEPAPIIETDAVGTVSTVTWSKHATGHWNLSVVVQRETPEGLSPVSLATLVEAPQP